MSGLNLIFSVQGEESSPRLWSRPLKLKPRGVNKKDHVQTRNEEFPRIWFWENLTPPERTGGEITPRC